MGMSWEFREKLGLKVTSIGLNVPVRLVSVLWAFW